MKTFVITVSRNFPATHKRKGEPTYFSEKIACTLGDEDTVVKFIEEFGCILNKIHTIRDNYPFWEKRIKQVQECKAILSVRYWSGKPYNSKQIEICQLEKDDGVGIQKLRFLKSYINAPVTDFAENGLTGIDVLTLCKNDGLSIDDFKEWFKKYDLSEPMAIIHFTKFRY